MVEVKTLLHLASEDSGVELGRCAIALGRFPQRLKPLRQFCGARPIPSVNLSTCKKARKRLGRGGAQDF